MDPPLALEPVRPPRLWPDHFWAVTGSSAPWFLFLCAWIINIHSFKSNSSPALHAHTWPDQCFLFPCPSYPLWVFTTSPMGCCCISVFYLMFTTGMSDILRVWWELYPRDDALWMCITLSLHMWCLSWSTCGVPCCVCDWLPVPCGTSSI